MSSHLRRTYIIVYQINHRITNAVGDPFLDYVKRWALLSFCHKHSAFDELPLAIAKPLIIKFIYKNQIQMDTCDYFTSLGTNPVPLLVSKQNFSNQDL